jgi:uncharacterized damage-inducible protein DinB
MKSGSLISAVEDVLRQGRVMLTTVSGEAYARKEDGTHGASLGAHYRHVLDHFQCLLEGIESGEINYDHRLRSPELESLVDVAVLATERLLEKFRALPAYTWQRECTVVYSVGYGDSETQAVPSTLSRELMFCVGHSIHHFAILKLLCAGMSVTLPYEFGVAPSTLKHLEAQTAH